MAVSTRELPKTEGSNETTVAVINPAFLQDIKDSHPQLWKTKAQLLKICNGSANTKAALSKLVGLLDQLRDEMALEFALEESYGYQTIMGSPRPTTGAAKIASVIPSELVDTARAQHCGLYLQVTELSEQAEELQYRGMTSSGLKKLIRSTLDFDREFSDHEELENQLIENSFDAA